MWPKIKLKRQWVTGFNDDDDDDDEDEDEDKDEDEDEDDEDDEDEDEDDHQRHPNYTHNSMQMNFRICDQQSHQTNNTRNLDHDYHYYISRCNYQWIDTVSYWRCFRIVFTI